MEYCPHGNLLVDCDICLEQAAAVTAALKARDTRELERLSGELRRDHANRNQGRYPRLPSGSKKRLVKLPDDVANALAQLGEYQNAKGETEYSLSLGIIRLYGQSTPRPQDGKMTVPVTAP